MPTEAVQGLEPYFTRKDASHGQMVGRFNLLGAEHAQCRVLQSMPMSAVAVQHLSSTRSQRKILHLLGALTFQISLAPRMAD
jgi:hypothetical protein